MRNSRPLSFIGGILLRARLVAITLMLLSTLSPALDIADSLELPARAWLSWTPREQCLYIMGIAHGEIDTILRLSREYPSMYTTFLPYCVHADPFEQFAAKLTAHISALPSDSEDTLFTAIMAVRWEIYPTNDIGTP